MPGTVVDVGDVVTSKKDRVPVLTRGELGKKQ